MKEITSLSLVVALGKLGVSAFTLFPVGHTSHLLSSHDDGVFSPLLSSSIGVCRKGKTKVRLAVDSSSREPPSPSTFRTTSRQPKKLIIDPKTGLYRPMKNQEEKKNPLLSWDGFKTLIYDGVDVVTQKLPQEIQKVQHATQDGALQEENGEQIMSGQHNVRPADLAASSSRNPIVGSYKEREQEFLKSLKDAPAQRLTTQFKVPENVNSRALAREADDVLIESTPFESFKSLMYKGFDAISSSSETFTGGENGSASSKAGTPSQLNRISSNLQTREVQARLLASDDDFLQAMEGLHSDNPVSRLAAGYKVRQMIEEDGLSNEKRMKAIEREEQVVALKSSIYQAGDALVDGVKALVELPPKIAETYQSTVIGTRKTIEVAQALPETVQSQVDNAQQKVDEVQQTVKSRVETTKDMIEKTKQLPSQIKTKVQETNDSVKRTAQQTKDVIKNIGETAQELTTSSKVFLGLEKPVPRPPKQIPYKQIQDEMSLSKLGLKTLWVTGSLAGKVTWAVGKETAKLAWQGAGLAISKGMEAVDAGEAKELKKLELVAGAAVPSKAADTSATIDGEAKEEVEVETAAINVSTKSTAKDTKPTSPNVQFETTNGDKAVMVTMAQATPPSTATHKPQQQQQQQQDTTKSTAQDSIEVEVDKKGRKILEMEDPTYAAQDVIELEVDKKGRKILDMEDPTYAAQDGIELEVDKKGRKILDMEDPTSAAQDGIEVDKKGRKILDMEDPTSAERLRQQKEGVELSVFDLEEEISEALHLAENAIDSAKVKLDDVNEEDGNSKGSTI